MFKVQSLSINLQRGNALCVIGTVAHSKKLYKKFTTYNLYQQQKIWLIRTCQNHDDLFLNCSLTNNL